MKITSRQSLYLQHHITNILCVFRIDVGNLSPRHVFNQLFFCHTLIIAGTHVGAVLEYRASVCDFSQLLQAVGDINNTHSLSLEFFNQRKQDLGLRERQHRGWLIHNQDLGIQSDRLCDLHKLLLGNPQLAEHGLGLKGRPHLLHSRLGQLRHLFVVYDAPVVGKMAHHNIVGNGKAVHQRLLLINNGNAVSPGLLR